MVCFYTQIFNCLFRLFDIVGLFRFSIFIWSQLLQVMFSQKITYFLLVFKITLLRLFQHSLLFYQSDLSVVIQLFLFQIGMYLWLLSFFSHLNPSQRFRIFSTFPKNMLLVLLIFSMTVSNFIYFHSPLWLYPFYVLSVYLPFLCCNTSFILKHSSKYYHSCYSEVLLDCIFVIDEF